MVNFYKKFIKDAALIPFGLYHSLISETVSSYEQDACPAPWRAFGTAEHKLSFRGMQFRQNLSFSCLLNILFSSYSATSNIVPLLVSQISRRKGSELPSTMLVVGKLTDRREDSFPLPVCGSRSSNLVYLQDSLTYQRSATLGCKDVRIKKLDFNASN